MTEETKLANKIKKFLEERGWYVFNLHGNKYQKGLPDKICLHKEHGQRFIELKVQNKYKFTPAQLNYFPLFDKCKIGIWILTDANENQYRKLFMKPNWKEFLTDEDIRKIQILYDWFTYST